MKLLAIGSAYVDINCPGFHFSEKGLFPETEIVGNDYEIVLGGSAVNFARLCVRLGLPTAFVGKAGLDNFGKILKNLFDESGVEAHLVVDPSSLTNISFNMVNDLKQSIMAVAGTANQTLESHEIKSIVNDLLGDCSHIYIGGCFKQPQLMSLYHNLLDLTQNKDKTTILDHGRVPETASTNQKDEIKNFAKKVDYYLPSKDEFLELWGVKTIGEGLKNLKESSKAVVIVKDGSKGAWTLINSKPVCISGFSVRQIHAIGAGDSFNAGFIVAQSKGLEIIDSVRYACAVAALKISQNELPSEKQVEELFYET